MKLVLLCSKMKWFILFRVNYAINSNWIYTIIYDFIIYFRFLWDFCIVWDKKMVQTRTNTFCLFYFLEIIFINTFTTEWTIFISKHKQGKRELAFSFKFFSLFSLRFVFFLRELMYATNKLMACSPRSSNKLLWN